MASRDAGTNGERRADVGCPVLQVGYELDRFALFHGYDHAAVAEPLGDSHSTIGSDHTDNATKGAQDAASGIVAERGCVVRESGQVDEHERAGDTHEFG